MKEDELNDMYNIDGYKPEDEKAEMNYQPNTMQQMDNGVPYYSPNPYMLNNNPNVSSFE